MSKRKKSLTVQAAEKRLRRLEAQGADQQYHHEIFKMIKGLTMGNADRVVCDGKCIRSYPEQ